MGIVCILCHSSAVLAVELSVNYPVRALPSHFSKIHFNIILPSIPVGIVVSFPPVSPLKVDGSTENIFHVRVALVLREVH